MIRCCVLHGAGGNRGWLRWMDAVAERHTIYAPTHPGFGRSDAADWMEGIDDLARFYLWFLDVMGLERVHLLGHSIGGWTAAEMATMCPGVIDRLVLVAPAGLKPEEGEILDIFYYPPEELLELTVYDPATDPGVGAAVRPAAHAGGGGDRRSATGRWPRGSPGSRTCSTRGCPTSCRG